MAEGKLSHEDLQALANAIADEVANRFASSVPITRMRAIGWNCTGSEYTCGKYVCVGTVGCTNIFRCTVEFSG